MKYNPEQVARIRAESERLLRDDSPPPAPAPERVIVFEDDMDRHRREAREFDERRAQAKAELRRAEGDAARVLSALGRVAALEARCAELEQSLETSNATMRELAASAAAFADSVDQGLQRVQTKLLELSTTLTEMRALEDVRRGEVLDLPDFRRRAN